MNFKKIVSPINFLLILSLILTTIDLEINPIGLNQDESSNGYDAFAISENWRDQHGVFLPLLLKSYGDFASPLLSYINVFFVKFLGLSTFSVRLSVALLGSLSVYFFYLILFKLFRDIKVSFLGTFIYASSPLFLTFSRWAVPPSIVPFFIVITFYFALKCFENEENNASISKKQELINFSLLGLFSGLLILSYPTQKLFVPVFSIFLFLLFYKKYWKKMLLSLVILLLLTLPQYLLTFFNPDLYNARFIKVASLTNTNENFLNGFFTRYFEYFSFDFWFGVGDTQIIHHVPNIAALHPFLSYFYFSGLLFLIINCFIKEKNDTIKLNFFKVLPNKIALLLFVWFLLFPVAASLTKDHFLTTRVIHGFPLVILLISLSLFLHFKMLKKVVTLKEKALVSNVLCFGIIIITAFFTLSFLREYHGNYKQTSKHAFHYGVKQAFTFVAKHEKDFDTIIIDNNIHVPDFLFFTKYDPKLLQKENKTSLSKSFGKYQFKNVAPYFDLKFERLFTEKSDGKIWSEVVFVSKNKIAILMHEAQD